MGEFFRATLHFPTVLFTLGVVCAVVYWPLVMAGVVEPNSRPARESLAAEKFGDIPPALLFTSMSTQGWFWALLGTTLFEGSDDGQGTAFFTRVVIAVVALCLAYLGTCVVVFCYRRARDAQE